MHSHQGSVSGPVPAFVGLHFRRPGAAKEGPRRAPTAVDCRWRCRCWEDLTAVLTGELVAEARFADLLGRTFSALRSWRNAHGSPRDISGSADCPRRRTRMIYMLSLAGRGTQWGLWGSFREPLAQLTADWPVVPSLLIQSYG